MKSIAIILWFCGIGYFFKVAADRAEVANLGQMALVTPPPLSSFDSSIVNILTLGQKNLYDDFIDIWLIQILGDPTIKTENPVAINKVILQITKQQPKIESLYMLACFVMALDFHRPEYCEEIMLDGLHAFPNSWRLPMTQGFMYAFQLKDPLKAAAFYNLASSRPESPEYVGRLAKKYLNQEPIDNEDLQKTLDVILKIPGGSRFTDFLKNNSKNNAEPNKE